MLLSDEVASSSKAALMLSLVHKAMGADLRAARVAAFAKRLLQLALAHAAPFACGCLIVVSDILQVRASHIVLPASPAVRVASFAKRLLQLALAHAAAFVRCLIVVSDILQICSQLSQDSKTATWTAFAKCLLPSALAHTAFTLDAAFAKRLLQLALAT